jgi:hypothetical protein
MLDPLGKLVARMEKCLTTIRSLGSYANAHATASRMTTMAHNNAQHLTFPESPDVDRIDHDLPSRLGGVSALPVQCWTGVDPSLFGPKCITPQLGMDASGTPNCTTLPVGMDASGPQQ